MSVTTPHSKATLQIIDRAEQGQVVKTLRAKAQGIESLSHEGPRKCRRNTDGVLF